MQSSFKQMQTLQVELVDMTNELLPYGVLNKTSVSDDVNEDNYTVAYYPYQYDQLLGGLSGISPMGSRVEYAAQEQAYYNFVKDTYLSIPATLKTTLLALAEEHRIQATDYDVVSKVVRYIKNAAYYDYTYADEDYSDDKDMVTYFLTEHKRGVCRHFAAAATMMFRALGIPARYTIGFAVDVKANEWLVYGDDLDEVGHAWTEIYVQGYGWIPLEVTGSTLYTEGA